LHFNAKCEWFLEDIELLLTAFLLSKGLPYPQMHLPLVCILVKKWQCYFSVLTTDWDYEYRTENRSIPPVFATYALLCLLFYV